MNIKKERTYGLERLVNKFRDEFHISENINYYPPNAFKMAEKKYIEFRLKTGC